MTPKERARAYRLYLQSDHWKQLKQARRMTVGTRCETCGSAEKVEGHHVEYRNFIDCTWQDIRLLCQRCHQAIHKPEHSAKMKGLHREKLAQGKRWTETVSALVRKFRKKPTPAQLDVLIAELTDFRAHMK